MKKLTKQWLVKNNACTEAVKQWEKEGCEPDVIKLLNRCIEIKHLDWGNWLIVRQMKYKQFVSYAVYAAEQVIDLYEKKYPDDNRPRQAIEAAKACIKNPSVKNKRAAWAAARAAGAVEAAAWVAAWAARAAARAAGAVEAAEAAAGAAEAAAWAAGVVEAAAGAAEAAAGVAAWAAAGAAMQEKILRYGIQLLNDQR